MRSRCTSSWWSGLPCSRCSAQRTSIPAAADPGGGPASRPLRSADEAAIPAAFSSCIARSGALPSLAHRSFWPRLQRWSPPACRYPLSA
jgi:hypothetical protein